MARTHQEHSEALWNKLSQKFASKDDVLNSTLVKQGWKLVESVVGNNTITLPSIDTVTEIYIEMYDTDGTIVHHTDLRKESLQFESTNISTREIVLDNMHNTQTYVTYSLENNTIIPSCYEGIVLDGESTNVTTVVYIKELLEMSVTDLKANNIQYDNSVSGINSNDVQGAIDDIIDGTSNLKKINLNDAVSMFGTGNIPTSIQYGHYQDYTKTDIDEYIQTDIYPDLRYGLHFIIADVTGSKRGCVIIYKLDDTYGSYVRFGYQSLFKQYVKLYGEWSTEGVLQSKNNIQVINHRETENTPAVNTNYYQYIATKNCLINITMNACHGESRAKSVDICQNDVSVAGSLNHDGGTVSVSANLLLNVGDIVKCNANYLAAGNNLITIHGYVQFLE